MKGESKRCELCGAYLASDHVAERFCSPCTKKLRNLGLTDQADLRFYTVEEYAEEYRMGEEQVRRKCRDGEILAIKPGRRWLIPRQRVELAMPVESNKGLTSLGAFVSLFEDNYPMQQVISDLAQRPLPDVIATAISRLPPPDEVARQAVKLARDLPPPHKLIRGIRAFLKED